MNDRKQCALVFLAAILCTVLIVCALVAEKHHSNLARKLRIRVVDDDDAMFFSGSGNGSGFFSGSGMPDDNITNGTNETGLIFLLGAFFFYLWPTCLELCAQEHVMCPYRYAHEQYNNVMSKFNLVNMHFSYLEPTHPILNQF